MSHQRCAKWGHGEPFCMKWAGVEKTTIHALRDCAVALHVWHPLVPTSLRLTFFVGHLTEWVQDNVWSNVVLEQGQVLEGYLGHNLLLSVVLEK